PAIGGSDATDQLREGLDIFRRSTCRISPVAERLVEPSIAAAHGDAALLASGLPRKAEARSEGIPRSAILVVTVVGAHRHAGGRRPEGLAGVGIDLVRIVAWRHGKPDIRAGSRRDRHRLQERGPSIAQIVGPAK